jgi:hypothetical protein
MKKPGEKWFNLINTTLGVVLGFALGLVASFYAQKLEHHQREEAVARLLAYSVRADLGRAMGMRSEIRDRILPDKSFRLYPSALTTLHDIELLNSLKPSVGELKSEVVEAFVKYEFETRQCILVRDMVGQTLQKEWESGGTNRANSESALNAYSQVLQYLEQPGTNLLFQIELKYPNVFKK